MVPNSKKEKHSLYRKVPLLADYFAAYMNCSCLTDIKLEPFFSFFSTGKTDSSSKNGGSPSRHDKSKDDTSDNHKDDPVQNNVTEEIKN